MTTSVFERTEVNGDILSDTAYNLAIGLVLCWGFLANWAMVSFIPFEALRRHQQMGVLHRLFCLLLSGPVPVHFIRQTCRQLCRVQSGGDPIWLYHLHGGVAPLTALSSKAPSPPLAWSLW